MRKKYNRLIFGDSADNAEFKNEDAYQYWSERKSDTNRRMNDYEEMQERVKEKLRNFKDYDDFLRNFENHREKHEHRTHLMREEGWKELNDKYGTVLDYKVHAPKIHEDEYVRYGAQYEEGYWDTKANHLYYSQPAMTRAWLQMKKVGRFYLNLIVLWGVIGGACLYYNVINTLKKTNVSKAYDIIHN